VDQNFVDSYGLSWLIENGYKMYLMISNTSSTEQSFCLQTIPAPNGTMYVLPTDNFFIQSQSSYAHQSVVLDASYAQPIPGFLFNTYSSY